MGDVSCSDSLMLFLYSRVDNLMDLSDQDLRIFLVVVKQLSLQIAALLSSEQSNYQIISHAIFYFLQVRSDCSHEICIALSQSTQENR